MDRNTKNSVKAIIAQADTVEKAWELFASLLRDGNGYTPETYLTNARAYAAVAVEMNK